MGDEPFILDADEGKATWFLGTLVVDRVTAEDTDGAYSITEHRLSPDYETPFHRHRREGEAFYILEGEFTIYTEDGTLVATPGQTGFLPANHAHGYRITSDEPARKLVIIWPGGFEQFFHEAGESATERTIPEPTEPDIEKLEALAPKYDLELLGPLPEAAD